MHRMGKVAQFTSRSRALVACNCELAVCICFIAFGSVRDSAWANCGCLQGLADAGLEDWDSGSVAWLEDRERLISTGLS